MAQKLKMFIGAAGLALLITVAIFAYNRFTAQENLSIYLTLSEEPDNAYDQRQRARDFALTDWDGNSLRFYDILAAGKPVILNFWASWCPACRNETPGFERVYRDRGGEVKFVMLNFTDGVRETVQTGQQYIEEGGFTLPVYFDTLLEGINTYGIRSLPSTIIIDSEGYIVAAMRGTLNEETLRFIVDFVVSYQ